MVVGFNYFITGDNSGLDVARDANNNLPTVAKDMVFFFKEIWAAELPEVLHTSNDYV